MTVCAMTRWKPASIQSSCAASAQGSDCTQSAFSCVIHRVCGLVLLRKMCVYLAQCDQLVVQLVQHIDVQLHQPAAYTPLALSTVEGFRTLHLTGMEWRFQGVIWTLCPGSLNGKCTELVELAAPGVQVFVHLRLVGVLVQLLQQQCCRGTRSGSPITAPGAAMQSSCRCSQQTRQSGLRPGRQVVGALPQWTFRCPAAATCTRRGGPNCKLCRCLTGKSSI